MSESQKVSMPQLRQALEAAWSPETAFLNALEDGNPALGNCYPTARVVQYYFPKTEIAEGKVWTEKGIEKHFWNILVENDIEYHIDFSWQQFPHGSYVISWKIRDRETLGDSNATLMRVNLMLERVKQFLGNMNGQTTDSALIQ